MTATPDHQDAPRASSIGQREAPELAPKYAAENGASESKEHGKVSEETSDEQTTPALDKYQTSRLRRILTPRNCRWDPKSPPPFNTALCILYAIVSPLSASGTHARRPLTILVGDLHRREPLLQPAHPQQDRSDL